MAYRIALSGFVLLGLICTCVAGQIVTVDGPDQVPKRQIVTKDINCVDAEKCVDKRDLTLECRNGGSVHATIVQPHKARATLTSMTYKGKPLRDETLHTINLMLSDRSRAAVMELEGFCESHFSVVYVEPYPNAYLETRHQEGTTIIISVTTDGQEDIQVRPPQ